MKKVIELGLRRSEAHRPAGPQLGRISVVVHRHADGHVRGGRHRRAADQPHRASTTSSITAPARPAGHHGGGPGAHGRGRHAVDHRRSCTRISRRSSTCENIKTPFMILHGTADNAVDWHQGLEFYGAARRWGKQVILLSYPGRAAPPRANARTRRTSSDADEAVLRSLPDGQAGAEVDERTACRR